jgi:ribosomal protein S1
MPFQSEAQRRLLWLKKPDIAKRWAHEYPGQRNLPYHKGDDEPEPEKKSASEGSRMSNFMETVIDACQASAAAIGRLEEQLSEKLAADKAYSEKVSAVVDACVKSGAVDDVEEEKQALAVKLASPVDALDVLSFLATKQAENTSASLPASQVDQHGRPSVKRASYDSLTSPYVGRRTTEKSASWERLEAGLGLGSR